MYASYNMLYNDCGQTPFTAHTDQSRFFCSSLPFQKEVRKSVDSSQLFPLNIPCTHDCKINDPNCQYKCSVITKPPSQYKVQPQLQKTKIVKENFSQTFSPEKHKLTKQDYDKLLPVMDPKFNLREICKQCILLEDHLSHNEKRCFDCCVKHFLTIEALAEEAITLENQPHCEKILNLPSRVRSLQSKWYNDPHQNSHMVSQELRQIRKDFQLDAFDIIFQNTSCKDGVCKITK